MAGFQLKSHGQLAFSFWNKKNLNLLFSIDALLVAVVGEHDTCDKTAHTQNGAKSLLGHYDRSDGVTLWTSQVYLSWSEHYLLTRDFTFSQMSYVFPGTFKCWAQNNLFLKQLIFFKGKLALAERHVQ